MFAEKLDESSHSEVLMKVYNCTVLASYFAKSSHRGLNKATEYSQINLKLTSKSVTVAKFNVTLSKK